MCQLKYIDCLGYIYIALLFNLRLLVYFALAMFEELFTLSEQAVEVCIGVALPRLLKSSYCSVLICEIANHVYDYSVLGTVKASGT